MSLPFKVKALYDYDATEKNELDLKKDKEYTISEKNGDWWHATSEDGKDGWVPSNYVGMVSDDKNNGMKCCVCTEKLSGSYVTANQNRYHEKCFFCINCKEMLSGNPHIEKDGNIYCKKCYEELFSPKCALCNEVIQGKYIKALDKDWHENHFICCDCGAPFKDKYHKYEEMPYCEECFIKNFQKTCNNCGKVLNGVIFEFGDLKIHEDCFKCIVDGKKLNDTSPFRIQEGKIYCEDHYKEKFTRICGKCTKKIASKYVEVGTKSFHEECLQCHSCKKSLINEQIHLDGENFICEEDFAKKREKESKKDEKNVEVKMGDESKTQMKADIEKEAKEVQKIYTYEELTRPREKQPKILNYSIRETYLSDEDFKKVFGMDKKEFYKQTLWKQRLLKRERKLF